MNSLKPTFACLSLALALAAGLASAPARGAGSDDQVLTNAEQVRELSTAEAELPHRVDLHGVVTFYDTALFSHFIQDDSAGIYLEELSNAPALTPGQLVEVEGVVSPGEFAPIVKPSRITVIGRQALPAPKPVSLGDLVSGREDSQYVEFRGLVRAVNYDPDSRNYLLDVVAGGERFTVASRQVPAEPPGDLVDSTVDIKGVCSTMFNHQRQLFGFRLLVPDADGLAVVTAAPHHPYDLPLQTAGSLLQFSPQGAFGHRVKLAGTVVYDEPGSAVFIQDSTGGLHCQTRQRDPLQPGDQIEVLGFTGQGQYSPVLEDTIFRKVGGGKPVSPVAADVDQILTGVDDGRLVTLNARVLDRVQRGVNQFLLLQSSDFVFPATLPRRTSQEFDALPNGSEVRVTGVCLIERGNDWQAGENWRAASFNLLLRSPGDVVVLQNPATLKSPDGLWLAAASAAIAVLCLGWLMVVRVHHRNQVRRLRGGLLSEA